MLVFGALVWLAGIAVAIGGIHLMERRRERRADLSSLRRHERARGALR